MQSLSKFLIATTALSTLMLSGCMTGPYVESIAPRPGLKRSADDIDTNGIRKELSSILFETETTNIKTAHISVGAADQYGRFLIDAYNKALQASSLRRQSSNFTSIWGGIVALGLQATDNGGDTALITALSATGLGISSRVLISPSHEAAYSLGARQVMCVLSAATDSRPKGGDHKRIKGYVSSLETLAKRYDDEYKAAELKVPLLKKDAIAKSNRKVEAVVAYAKDRADEYSATSGKMVPPTFSKTDGGNFIEFEVAPRIDAVVDRNKLPEIDVDLLFAAADSETSAFLNDYDRLGEQLFNRVESIRMQVNDAVRRTEPDLIQLNDNLRATVDGGLGFAGLPHSRDVDLQKPSGASLDPAIISVETIAGNNLNRKGLDVGSNPKVKLERDTDKVIEELKDAIVENWSIAKKTSIEFAEKIEAIEEALKALEARPVLAFPDNAFAACSGASIDAIQSAPPIAINPNSFTLAAGFEGGPISTEIAGGSAPYFVKDKPANVAVDGAIVTVTLAKDDIKPGGQDLQYVLVDTLGKATIFTIKQPPAPETPAVVNDTDETNGGDDEEPVADPTARLSGDAVKDMQTKLMAADNGDLIENFAITEVDNYLAKPDKSFVDSDFGEITRRVTQKYINYRIERGLTVDVMTGSCPVEDGKLLTALNARTDDQDAIFYSDAVITSTKRQDMDEPLFQLTVCLIDNP